MLFRSWEQEFTQLRPVKRRGNRRYYQHHEVLLVRRIRELLYGEGFTIIGARGRLDEEANGGQTVLTRRRGTKVVKIALGQVATDDINLEALRTDLIDIANLLDAG